ncbi:MAG: penicillin acylase family protein, partial [Planctomycetes bacterium]|nr:penicillin acylase family protein [Planctomycetota bacterium]
MTRTLIALTVLSFTLAVEHLPTQANRAAPAASTAATLASKVTIRRDTFGIPHILAETDEAAGFGLGYAQAENHCLDMVRLILAARGEEARYFGAVDSVGGAPGGRISAVEDDVRMKRYEVHAIAARRFHELSPSFQRFLHAFAAGLNAYVQQHRATVGDWVPSFDGVDVLARARAWLLRFTLVDRVDELQRKYAPSSGSAWSADAAGDAGAGSNMWGLAGSRTTSGHPILLGNPHLRWTETFWEAQVTVPGRMNFFGANVLGAGFSLMGFNDHLGWVHTNSGPDINDFYALTPDPAAADHYLFGGKSLPLTRREVTVEVSKSESQRREYWDSHLGPIVYRAGRRIFALRSVALENVRFCEQWYEMSRATSWARMEAILRANALPSFNLGYADAAGTIYYLWNATLPKRVNDGMSYTLDVPADTSKYVWTTFHETRELPQLLNPPGGYFQNTNNSPRWTSTRDRLDLASYPIAIEAGRPSLRTQQSLALLDRQEKFSLEDIVRLKFDTTLLIAERVKPALLDAARREPRPSDDLQRGVRLMEAWNNHADADSRGTLLFTRFWQIYTQAGEQARPVFLDRHFAQPWDEARPFTTPAGLADPAAAVKALEEAVR